MRRIKWIMICFLCVFNYIQAQENISAEECEKGH